MVKTKPLHPQHTPKGFEIPIPKRDDVLRSLKQAAKPAVHSPAHEAKIDPEWAEDLAGMRTDAAKIKGRSWDTFRTLDEVERELKG